MTQTSTPQTSTPQTSTPQTSTPQTNTQQPTTGSSADMLSRPSTSRTDSLDLTSDVFVGEFNPTNNHSQVETPVLVSSESEDSGSDHESNGGFDDRPDVIIRGPSFHGEGVKVGVLKECSTQWERDDLELQLWYSKNVGGRVMPTIGSIEQVGIQALTLERALLFVIVSDISESMPDKLKNFLRNISNMKESDIPLIKVVQGGTPEGKSIISKYNVKINEDNNACAFILCVPTVGSRILPVEWDYEFRSVEAAVTAVQNAGALVDQYRVFQKEQRQRQDIKAAQDQKAKNSSNIDKEKEKNKDQSSKKETENNKNQVEGKKTKKARKVQASKEKTIRADRAARVEQQQKTGEVIDVRVMTPIGSMTRSFRKGVKYQEVYDWLGMNPSLPLFFVLTNLEGISINPHDTVIEKAGGVLRLIEYTEGEIKDEFGQESIFLSGTIPDTSAGEIPTLVDEVITEKEQEQQERNEQEQKNGDDQEERNEQEQGRNQNGQRGDIGKRELKKEKRKRRRIRLKELKKKKI